MTLLSPLRACAALAPIAALFCVALFCVAPAKGADLFWYDGNVGMPMVQRCDVASCAPANFATPSSIPTGDMAIDPLEGMVYWPVNGSTKVQRRSLSGGAVEDIFDLSSIPSSSITGMALDPVARQVYLATPSSSSRIRRYPIDNPTSPTDFLLFNDAGCAPQTCSAQGLALDLVNGFLYFADPSNARIARKALDLATPLEDVVTGVAVVNGIALDVANDRVYFTYHSTTTRLAYALLSSPATVVDLVDPLEGTGSNGGWAGTLERDPSAGTLGEMYLSLSGNGEIRHCDLDAGCPTPLVLLTSGLTNNNGLALLGAAPVPALGRAGALGLGALMMAAAVWVSVRHARKPIVK